MKLSNLLSDKNDNVRLCDFGLLKEFGKGSSDSRKLTHEVQPTPYMDPEYKRLRDSRGTDVEVKPEYDQYGFAIGEFFNSLYVSYKIFDYLLRKRTLLKCSVTSLVELSRATDLGTSQQNQQLS